MREQLKMLVAIRKINIILRESSSEKEKLVNEFKRLAYVGFFFSFFDTDVRSSDRFLLKLFRQNWLLFFMFQSVKDSSWTRNFGRAKWQKYESDLEVAKLSTLRKGGAGSGSGRSLDTLIGNWEFFSTGQSARLWHRLVQENIGSWKSWNCEQFGKKRISAAVEEI